MKIPEIVIVNEFEEYAGITKYAKTLYDTLKSRSFNTTWIQCVDFPVERIGHYWKETVYGDAISINFISKGFNRLFNFPRKIPGTEDKLLIISDPWLLNLAKRKGRKIAIVHDIRNLTKHRGDILQTILFSYLITKLRKVELIITMSETTMNELDKLLSRHPPIKVLYPPIHKSQGAEKHILQSTLNVKNSKRVNIGYVANDQTHKDLRTFINIAEKMEKNPTYSNLHFLLLSKLRSKTEKIVKSKRLNNLTVLPILDSVDTFYKEIDILLHLSKYEGFGLPVLEAMSYGIPVIGRDLPIMREVLDKNGILLNGNSLKEIEKNILYLLYKDNYKKFADLSLKRIEYFSNEKYIAKINAIINEFYS